MHFNFIFPLADAMFSFHIVKRRNTCRKHYGHWVDWTCNPYLYCQFDKVYIFFVHEHLLFIYRAHLEKVDSLSDKYGGS